MTGPKTKPEPASVADFIAAIADDTRRRDCDQYRYRYASGQEGDWPIVGLSPRKQALTLYITPGFAQHGALLARLGKYTTGKACLYVKRLADIDLGVLETLVCESVAQMRRNHPR